MTQHEFDQDRTKERSQSAHVVASLAVILIVVVAVVTASRDTARPPQIADPQDCVAIVDGGARLACYDRALHRNPSEPARGANAPVE